MTARKRNKIDLPVPITLEPMEAELTNELPEGEGWIFEPKWDGFRCLVFRSGESVELQSKAGKPLARYFPDVVDAVLQLPPEQFVLDGEIVIPVGAALSFDDLLLRIHPAESRVQKLAASTPASFVAFDLLVDESGNDLTREPLAARREALERMAQEHFEKSPRVRLSPSTPKQALARKWLEGDRQGLDGVMAKKADQPYQSGNRTGMLKVKKMRTAECVIGGFRRSKTGKGVASLLLGLYGSDGLLHHVGFCSALNQKGKAEALKKLEPLEGGEGFTGREPTGQSRWRKGDAAEWIRVEPSLVVEVQYDHFSGGRFRHGTKFMRWRPDKAPESCSLEQVEREGVGALKML